MKIIIGITALFLLFTHCSEMEIKWVSEFKPLGTGNYRINSVSSSHVTGEYWTAEKGPYCITAKYDTEGDLVWHAVYSKDDILTARGKSIIVNKEYAIETEMSIYTLCYAADHQGMNKIILIKYDSLGTVLWEKVIKTSLHEIFAEMLQDYQGNIYAAGWIVDSEGPYNLFVVKHDRSGKLIWAADYSNPSLVFRNLKFDVRKGDQFVVSGILEDTKDFFFARVDSLGNFLNLIKHDSPEQEYMIAGTKLDEKGNVYLTGSSFNIETNSDFVIIAYDTENNLLWTRHFDGAEHLEDLPRAIAVDESSNVYVCGISHGRDVGKILTIKYDKQGNELWTTSYSGKKNESAEPYMLYPGLLLYGRTKTSCRFNIVGSIGSDVVLLQHNTRGFYSWVQRYSGGKGTVNKPTACSGKLFTVESVSEERSKAFIVKYGESEPLGISRWD